MMRGKGKGSKKDVDKNDSKYILAYMSHFCSYQKNTWLILAGFDNSYLVLDFTKENLMHFIEDG